jgi:dTDP-4-amino-4,6-dideoxygalactose transaminase
MLSAKLAAAAKQGCLPKVVIPVHFSGEPCDMAAIAELSREYGFSVIEDAAHAIGARYRDHVVGDCKYSDITVFSFHPVKIITTAEGGVATTNSAKLAQSMARLRTHGITRSPTEMTKTPDGPWYYEQIELGFNYRMTEMQAALGRSQLVHLDEWVGKRQLIAEKYDLGLASTPLTLPFRAESNRSALHLYVVLVPDPTGAQRARVFQDLRNAGIGVNVHYIPVHLQPDFARLGFVAGAFPESELYYRRALSLPMFSGLSADDQNTVIAAVRQALL